MNGKTVRCPEFGDYQFRGESRISHREEMRLKNNINNDLAENEKA